MKTFKPAIIAASTLIFLAGCGGGGSGSSQPQLEGAFTGSLSNGDQLTNIVFEDDSFWSAYQTPSGEIRGFSKGKVISNDGNFTVTFLDFAKPGDNPVAGHGTGVYTSSSAAGSVTTADQTLTFEVTTPSANNYIYRTPASISSVVGSWKGKLLDGEDASVDILPDGIFSGSSSNGCQFNGKFQPNDVNVFNVSVTFGGAPCALPGITAKGIGLSVLRNNGKNQLTVAVVDDAHTVGSLFQASR